MSDTLTRAPPAAYFKLVTDQWTQPFWDAAARHELSIPRCASCKRFRMPPSPFCPRCQSQDVEWVAVDGRGTVYSYTVITTPILPDAVDSVPYLPAVIVLNEAPGVRLIACIIGARITDVVIGSPVTVLWDDLDGGITVPRFQLIPSPTGLPGAIHD